MSPKKSKGQGNKGFSYIIEYTVDRRKLGIKKLIKVNFPP